MDTSLLRRRHDLLHKVGKIDPTSDRADDHHVIEDYEIHIAIRDRSERGTFGTTDHYVIKHHHPIDFELLCELEQKILDHDEKMEFTSGKNTNGKIREIIKSLKIKNK